ncbi:MAG: 50S ribosome-binding GTPase [Thermoguttaceae bacterium]|nr:50S ribosome-binding GTPase [Thermoguttaceae bacterium]
MSLEVLASFDGILNRVDALCEHAPSWRPAQDVVPYLRRVRNILSKEDAGFNDNIVVALLGGTGVGKSTLVNALLGEQIAQASPIRPTTRQATLYCSKGYTATMIGLPEDLVSVTHCASPLLQNIMLVDCPDPDSAEEDNLTTLRAILPHCDVIIHVTTLQKYKNDAIVRELKSASVGGSLIWVQTHADLDDDIRQDWKRELEKDFKDVDKIFFVDSKKALEDQLAGKPLEGDFAKLVETLSNQLPRIGVEGIRRYHFLDIAEDSLYNTLARLENERKPLDELESKIQTVRQTFVDRLIEKRVADLKDDSHQWERRIRTETIRQWGTSPFSLALQIYGSLDSLLFSSLLFRARSVTQLAVLGTVEAARKAKSWLSEKQSQSLLEGVPVNILTSDEQVKNRMIISDAIQSAGLPENDFSQCNTQFNLTTQQFMVASEAHLDDAVTTIAKKNSHWFRRGFYETLLLIWIFILAWLPFKNFFYDYLYKGFVNEVSQPRSAVERVVENGQTVPVAISYRSTVLYPTYVYVVTAIWFVLGTGLLTLVFSRRCRRGVEKYIDNLSKQWKVSFHANLIFESEQDEIRQARRFITNVSQLISDIQKDKQQLNAPGLSRRKAVK